MNTESSLHGITVLDLTQAMSGPLATMLLGDLGAEVIKVEPPKGDQSRSWTPPFINNMSAYFLSVNRNKKSMVIDLKKEPGLEVFRKLVLRADVIVENFRPGTMKKLGLDYDSLRQLNDKIVYCSISGYGHTGPKSNWPGYDITVLASSGLMSINGEEGRPPMKFGVPIADITSGLFADIAILGALYERTKSGKGQFIDMSMLDASFLTLTNQAFSYFATNENPKKMGSAHNNIAPYQAFQTSDGHIVIAVGTEKLWIEFCRCIGREDLVNDPLFCSNKERVKHRDELVKEINSTLIKMPSESILSRLLDAGIPAAPIDTIEEAVKNQHILFREMVSKMNAPYGEIPMLGTPFKLSRTPGELREHPPMLGEDTEEILESIGFDKGQIEKLKKEKIINSTSATDS